MSFVATAAGEKFPAMDPARRRDEVAQLETSSRRAEAAIEKLIPVVGDPETIVDQRGQSQADRRESSFLRFRFDREHAVRRLRGIVAEMNEQQRSAPDRAAKAEVRKQLTEPKAELDRLLAIPPLTADDMCGDCYHPRLDDQADD